MDKWDRFGTGLSFVIFGIYSSIIEFFFTEQFKIAYLLIPIGIGFEVLIWFNILPTPEIRAKLLEKELLYDETTRDARKKRKRQSNQVLIIIGVIGLAVMGYQWYTDTGYKSYSGYGFSFEYPEKMGEVIDASESEFNATSSDESGIISVDSNTEYFQVWWRSDKNASQTRNFLNLMLDLYEDNGELTMLEYTKYSIMTQELLSAHFHWQDEEGEKFIIIGIGFCEHSNRLFGIQHIYYENNPDSSTFTHFLETFECH